MSDESAARVTIDFLRLPYLAVRPGPESVLVTVDEPNDLAAWLKELPGEVRVSAPQPGGVALWSLLTFTMPDGDGARVPLTVSTVAPLDTPVLDEVAAAVAW
ncbi:hypothetical protein [Streptomyces sp. NPDC047097]|uniref:hypothetical protein n=1 Tax=Streptomyces sp. NPDC047097 TaxID=3155260 RepID=UPI0033F9FEED